MADIDNTNLPAGVSIAHDWASNIAYTGSESALIDGGIICAAWINGLGKASRRITVDMHGGFQIVGEGKAGSFTLKEREQGALTIKRLPNGRLQVAKYRTKTEQQAIEAGRRAQYECENEQATWKQGKVARLTDDYVGRWREGVKHHIQKTADFFNGRLVFQGFPTIKARESDAARVASAVDELLRLLNNSDIAIADIVKEEKSNVIRLSDYAYRYMQQA